MTRRQPPLIARIMNWACGYRPWDIDEWNEDQREQERQRLDNEEQEFRIELLRRQEAALAALAQSDAERVKKNIEKLNSYGYRLPINAADLESPQPDDNFERHQNARISKLEHAMEIYQKALERISKSNLHDMGTLHPDGCAPVAAEALRAADRSGE
jgi:flagellar biosynthesis GTPase FlhF